MSSLNAGTITIHFTGDSAFDGLNGRLDVGIKSGATGNSLIASINANGSATIEEKGNRVTVEVPIVSNPSGSYYASLIDDETGEPAITGSLLYPHTKFFITIEEDTTWYVCKDRPITTEDFTLINQSYRCNRYVPYALNTGLERDYPIPLSEALKRLQGIRNTGNYRVTLHFLPWYEYLEGGSEFGSSVGIEEELSRHFEWVSIRGVENTPLLLRSDDYDPTESSNPLVTIEMLDIAYGCRAEVRELAIHSITSYQSDVTLTDTLLRLSPDLIPVIADQHSTLALRGDIRLTHSGWNDDPVPDVSSLLYGDNQSVVNLDSVVFHLEEDVTVDEAVSTIHCERGSIVNLSYLPSTAGLGAIHGKQFSMGEGCIFSTTGWTGDVDGEGQPDIDFSSGVSLLTPLMALGDVAGDVWLAIGTGVGGTEYVELSEDTTWYVSPTGTTLNDGLTVETPISLDEAFARIGRVDAVFAGSFSITITLQLASGTYSHRNYCRGNTSSRYPYEVSILGTNWIGSFSEPQVTISNFVSVENIAGFYAKNIKFDAGTTSIVNCYADLSDVSIKRVRISGADGTLYAHGKWLCRSTVNTFQCIDNALVEIDIDEVVNAGSAIEYLIGFVELNQGGQVGIDKAPIVTGTITGSRITYQSPNVVVSWGEELIDSLPGSVTNPYPNYLVTPSNTIQQFNPLTDKALYYYDAVSESFKPIPIGTAGQILTAQPANNPPYEWITPT